MREISGHIVFLTGADGGIGRALLNEFIKRGARKIYAAGINEERLQQLSSQFPGKVYPVLMDVTDDQAVRNAAKEIKDITILINNAGVELKSSFIGKDAAAMALTEMQVNYIGVIRLINEFLNHLKQNTPSYIVNILSVGSSAVLTRLATYCASKTAAHLLTQSLREQLTADNIDIIGVYPGYVDTPMSTDAEAIKISPQDLASAICGKFEKGENDIFPDEMSLAFFRENPIHLAYL